MRSVYRIGVDIGSTTIKAVVLSPEGRVVYTGYERHHARIGERMRALLSAIQEKIGNSEIIFHLTGSIGMGVAERCELPFVQEVVAATNYTRREYPALSAMIDIGGEDAKVVFFQAGGSADLRMNGNCAGGTGAFIDQMAILLGVSVDQLDSLAMHAEHIYPIASRCGVFSKTDIQNLIAKNVSPEDIAASIFHAVAVQVVVTLAHGCEITAPVLFCGGPLSFLPSLRKAFRDYLRLDDEGIVSPPDSHLIPAWGAALEEGEASVTTLSALIETIHSRLLAAPVTAGQGLAPIFGSEEEYRAWEKRISRYEMRRSPLKPGVEEVTIGIDSGSTTTKIVVLNRRNELLYTYYHGNEGNPIATVEKGLRAFQAECERNGTEIRVTGSCSTGYGEDLIKSAFRLDGSLIETIAHYKAACHLTDHVSFILDIGGQDMKAIFVSEGVVNRIEINEACSSGCGSFIETFAKSLDYSVQDFSKAACLSRHPYDLGTRCTVFMNSKVKQALREGAALPDIAAGLSYSVVKNCLYKVLRLRNMEELDDRIVVQGGTMRNDSVVRAFEKLIGKEVCRSDSPELMGAIGCALHAQGMAGQTVSLQDLLDAASYTVHRNTCRGCENNCLVTTYLFGGNRRYYSGNRCERVFSNGGGERQPGINAYVRKRQLLFDRELPVPDPVMVVGIPRCLNMFEEYPFWHTLFSACGVKVRLSAPSSFSAYESRANLVMSDNICFPAKLAHSHIQDLIERKVDRIFMPFVVFERQNGGQNSYNCPIVTGYSEVIKGVQGGEIPVDSPVISFKDKAFLRKQCTNYLRGLGIADTVIKAAFSKALEAMALFEREMEAYDRHILEESGKRGRLVILLAGRPYHTDPLIQHDLSDLLAGMGVDVITDDIVRGMDLPLVDTCFVPQWAYANRILKAAKWVAAQGSRVQFMQMTSFGCGPDAFLIDEVRELLRRGGKALTLLKIDDVNNMGSIRLRMRSAIESLRLSLDRDHSGQMAPFVTTPVYRVTDRRRKIIAPFFTPFISPLLPSLMRLAGYELECLPMSDASSCEWGLRYANNEVCYPATLVVGDIVKAFMENRYDPRETAVAITQTGGQCRATNYISLIKRALTEAGFKDVPVVSLSFGGDLGNPQPGFRIQWVKHLNMVLHAVLYSDCIAKFYYASVVRERIPGASAQLRDHYLTAAQTAIIHNSSKELLDLLERAASDFDRIVQEKEVPRVGIVGEIYLKFNPFAQKDLSAWLVSQGIEVVSPLLSSFFLQSFVNYQVKRNEHLVQSWMPGKLVSWLYELTYRKIRKVNRIGRGFRYFTPFEDIASEAEEAAKAISLSAQFGEGWLLPGEIISLVRQGVNHVVSLQPFGCIANQIVARGVERRVKRLCPGLRLLSLDFDSGVSDVNVANRIRLFVHELTSGQPHTVRT